MLESSIGLRLLERTSRSVTLTPAGRALLDDARRLLRMSDETALAVRRVPSGEGGSIVIGFTAASVHGPVTDLVRRLTERFPHVELVLRELVSADQLAAIASGDIDLGILRPPIRGAGFRSRPIYDEPLLLAANSAHPLVADGRTPAFAELDGHPMVLYSPVDSRYFHELLTSTADAQGVELRPVQYVTQVHTMLALVEAGIGIAVVPESARMALPRGVVLRSLADSPRAELVAAWRAGADNPALARTLSLLDAASAARTDTAML